MNSKKNAEIFYTKNLEELTKNNNEYRKVIFTGGFEQLVLMSINPLDDIKMEIHETHDQFIRIEQGYGKAIVGEKEFILEDNSAIIIPAGTPHQIINTNSKEKLKLYSIYSPPEHPDNLIQHSNPDKYKKKYLKYKTKYLETKKNI